MNKTQNNRKDFESILKGNISEDQLSVFEQEAKEGWASNTNDFETLSAEIDKRIDASTSTVAQKPKLAFIRRMIIMGIAASLLLLVSVVSYTNFFAPKHDEQLFAAHFKPAENFSTTVRGENSVANPIAEKASKAYNELDYSNAILYYKQLLQKDPNESKYLLFLGISYLANNDPVSTINLFNSNAYKSSPYEEDINWYLALAYLKKGDRKTSALLLQNLANSNSYYKVQAGTLLNSF